ncbi:LLM class flavin-dependent oxidoreductase [Ornithinimicrobium sufpigmenti]|uniref:LLM class flavin-dependent oxidoreductase n=1 Tax=Ornithinimicrobium sufpigmenti TaxID=2508882 RepID=UPI001036B159|nr:MULTISPECIES: LLM class flavin-dependent oxidoreductase [unclassified Ornithinimicrobium]
MSPLRFSVRVNNDVPAAELIELARAVEDAGFDQLWVSNDLFLRSAPALVGRLSAHTSRLHLGIGVVNPYSMHTAEIAMAAATLQELTQGRFLLGLGAGAAEFLGWVGLHQDSPLAGSRRALEELTAARHGQVPAGWNRAAHLRFEAAPFPVYVGAMGPRMLALAGELADGALPLLYPPEHYAAAAAQIARGAERAGRPVEELDIAACIWVSIDDDPERAARPLAEKIAYYGASFSPVLLQQAGLTPADFAPIQQAMNEGRSEEGIAMVTETMLQLGIAGTTQDVVERCRGLVARGARHLSFGPPLGPDLLQAVDRLGSEVLPALRAQPEVSR